MNAFCIPMWKTFEKEKHRTRQVINLSQSDKKFLDRKTIKEFYPSEGRQGKNLVNH